MNIGTTFSHTHARTLNLSIKDSFTSIIQLGLNPMRLCAYWNEIEATKGVYNFTHLHELLDMAQTQNIDICMSVGMKSPRWPEFHIPQWVVDIRSVLTFVQKTVEELRNYECIKWWQIENEPLDPSGPGNKTVERDLLEQEIELVKKIDPSRKTIITMWGNNFRKRHLLPFVQSMNPDIIGVDMYYRVPTHFNRFCGPDDDDFVIEKELSKTGAEIWVSELQGEPWEHGNNHLTGSPKSVTADSLADFVEKARCLNPTTILLWGSEYWLLQHKKGNPAWIDAVTKICRG